MTGSFDEIRITRLPTGYLSEFWFEGKCQYKMFDILESDGLSPGGQATVALQMKRMQQREVMQ